MRKADGKEVIVHEFTAKWDTRPEPWDYDNNKPKLEFIPFALEPENLLPGDIVDASIAVKHPKEKWFYIYDPNYYVAKHKNKVDGDLIRLRLIFSSQSISISKDFIVLNRDENTDGFQLKDL